MSGYSASNFDSTYLNAKAASSSLIYQRDVSMPLNSTLADAGSLGTLTTDLTQLDVKAQVSRENATHFYKFTLDGDSLKLGFYNNTGSSDIRLQVLNSSGTVIADSSTHASAALQSAYASLTTSGGLSQEAGDYYVKVTFDSGAMRSVPQAYSVAMYSGTRFSTSYQTTAKSQTSTKQAVLLDNTMTYSLINAKAYETKTTHIANETAAEAINIGWLYENKAALSVSSQLTSVCSAQFYTCLLQKGDSLKIAYNNHTNTSDTRVQLYDSSGTQLLADSHGTEAQKAAYESLSSSTGLAAKAGQYLIKISYADGAEKTKQIYDFKVYSGDVYESLYETKAGTETLQNALNNGRIVTNYSMKAATVSYLSSMSQGSDVSIMDALTQKF